MDKKQPYNYCHFTPMQYQAGDSVDGHPFEEWLECKHCGHTKPCTEKKDSEK